MKKTHIIILVGIAALIVALLAYSVDFSTYDSISSAKQKQGKFVHLNTTPSIIQITFPLRPSTAWETALKLFTITANQPTWKKVNALY